LNPNNRSAFNTTTIVLPSWKTMAMPMPTQSVSVTFEVTNTGDQPLRFTQKPYIEVAAGC